LVIPRPDSRTDGRTELAVFGRQFDSLRGRRVSGKGSASELAGA